MVLDEVWLDGAADQRRWSDTLGPVDVCWVGVRCPADVAAARETDRGDRPAGVARAQADAVHAGAHYDVEVDTARLDEPAATAVVAAWVAERWSVPGRPAGGAETRPPRGAWSAGGVGRPPWER